MENIPELIEFFNTLTEGPMQMAWEGAVRQVWIDVFSYALLSIIYVSLMFYVPKVVEHKMGEDFDPELFWLVYAVIGGILCLFLVLFGVLEIPTRIFNTDYVALKSLLGR